MKKLFTLMAIVSSITACGQHETVVYQQPAPAAVAQPVYVQNNDPMTGVLTGMAIGAMMSNGMRYDGHNGYYDSHYHGPSRTIVQKTTIINNTVVNKNVTPSTNNPVPSVSTPVVPVVNPVATNKVKNPGDQQALKDKAIDQRKKEIQDKIAVSKTR